MVMPSESPDIDNLLRQASDGDQAALAALFERYRKRLRQMVRLRLDRRLRGRVDPSDVLQEAYLDMAQQLPGYFEQDDMSFFLWLRLVYRARRMMRMHRQHLGAAIRDAGREVSLYKGGASASDVRVAGRTTAGTVYFRDAGGGPRRNAGQDAGSDQQHGCDGSRDHCPAAL